MPQKERLSELLLRLVNKPRLYYSTASIVFQPFKADKRP